MTTLSDQEIKELCGRGKIIVENYNDRNVKQACYELIASNIYYEITNDGQAEKNTVNENGYILIKPGQTVVIRTQEHIILPRNMLARILSKGKLFSVGLLPVNTYADPGFDGALGIVFYNSSHNYLKIIPGSAIAKMELCQLHKDVERPYHGQHGFGTETWIVPREMILSIEEIRSDPRIKDGISELKISHGEQISSIVGKLAELERKKQFSSMIFIILCVALLFAINKDSESPIIDGSVAVVIGILSNVAWSLLSLHERLPRLRNILERKKWT